MDDFTNPNRVASSAPGDQQEDPPMAEKRERTAKQIEDDKMEHNRRVLRGEVDPRVADLPNSEKLTRELESDKS